MDIAYCMAMTLIASNVFQKLCIATIVVQLPKVDQNIVVTSIMTLQ